jgi:hypothetical protein
MMKISEKRITVLREHIRAESEHDMEALLAGMTPDCFNDVVGVPKPFVGPSQTAERYRKHWEGFPDFTVRVRRILSADESCVVIPSSSTTPLWLAMGKNLLRPDRTCLFPPDSRFWPRAFGMSAFPPLLRVNRT